jgi:hypothetical protein
MLQQIGRPIDVHAVDRERMTEAIRRVQARVAARGLTIPAARA